MWCNAESTWAVWNWALMSIFMGLWYLVFLPLPIQYTIGISVHLLYDLNSRIESLSRQTIWHSQKKISDAFNASLHRYHSTNTHTYWNKMYAINRTKPKFDLFEPFPPYHLLALHLQRCIAINCIIYYIGRLHMHAFTKQKAATTTLCASSNSENHSNRHNVIGLWKWKRVADRCSRNDQKEKLKTIQQRRNAIRFPIHRLNVFDSMVSCVTKMHQHLNSAATTPTTTTNGKCALTENYTAFMASLWFSRYFWRCIRPIPSSQILCPFSPFYQFFSHNFKLWFTFFVFIYFMLLFLYIFLFLSFVLFAFFPPFFLPIIIVCDIDDMQNQKTKSDDGCVNCMR